MDTEIKVSIVVPVYNVEKYLKECIESLINQTLQEIEIICVNDGSTDSSLEILNDFASRDYRIHIISKENSGYGHTMNVGFAAAKGEYIGIVESDDYALPNMFETLYLLAKQYDVDMVKSNYYEYSEKNNRLLVNYLKDVPYNEVICPAETAELFMTSGICIWSAIYRNTYIKENNITFHETPGASYQDVSFGYVVLLYAKKILCIKDAFLCYRVDNADSSVKSREKVFCVMEEFQRWQDCALKAGKNNLIKKTCSNKFRHFMGHYYRVDDLFKYAFITKVADIFNDDYDRALLDEDYWDRAEWNMMQSIRRNPMEFYKETCETYKTRFVLGKYTSSESIRNNSLKKAIQDAENVIIYGAGVYGTKLYNNIKTYDNVKYFAVSNIENNKKEFDNIPIKKIDELLEQRQDALVVVAVKWEYQLPILEMLHELKFQNVVSVYDCLDILN